MGSFILAFLMTFSGSLSTRDSCGCIKAKPSEQTGRGGHEVITIYKRTPYKQIRGTVIDPTGDTLEGALVEVFVNSDFFSRNTDTSKKERRVAACKTIANGKFCFPNLPPGKYELRISQQGFCTTHMSLIVATPIQRSSSRQITVTLAVGL
jgi:hypothetical protein